MFCHKIRLFFLARLQFHVGELGLVILVKVINIHLNIGVVKPVELLISGAKEGIESIIVVHHGFFTNFCQVRKVKVCRKLRLSQIITDSDFRLAICNHQNK